MTCKLFACWHFSRNRTQVEHTRTLPKRLPFLGCIQSVLSFICGAVLFNFNSIVGQPRWRSAGVIPTGGQFHPTPTPKYFTGGRFLSSKELLQLSGRSQFGPMATCLSAVTIQGRFEYRTLPPIPAQIGPNFSVLRNTCQDLSRKVNVLHLKTKRLSYVNKNMGPYCLLALQ